MERIDYDDGAEADARFDVWAAGRTGYPLVDAGMRQLLGEGWMHNRVRMITASFLMKDLHIDWTRGARHFMDHSKYIRRWVPELAALPSDEIHEPWLRPPGAPVGNPEPVVDHRVERAEALARYHLVRSGREFAA